MRAARTVIVLFLMILSLPAKATVKIEEFKLPNGLTVLVKPDHRAPVVISEVWYKVGSSYEHNGLTGLSHALEHMMFKGTAKYPNGAFLKLIAENGGQENAFTSHDYTGYYEELATDKLPLSFKLEADRMRNLSIKADDFAREIQVVQEERRLRIDNNPQAKTYERFLAAAFITNPYRQPVVGWPADLENMTAEDLRSWYKTWYAPNNAYLIVVGDVEPKKVFALAKKYFGPLKPSQLPIIKPHENLSPLGQRTVVVKTAAKLPLLLMGYNTPSFISTDNKQDTYALEVLAAILGGSNSSRLEQKLVRQDKTASFISVDYDLYSRLPGLFTIAAIPTNDHSVANLQQAIIKQIKQIKAKPVSHAELQRIKAQVIANNVYMQDSIATQASLIGKLVSAGATWNEINNYSEHIQKIIALDIQQVAKKYLIADSLTVTELKPQSINQQIANNAKTANGE